MAEYDGLALNTPTLIRSTADFDVWATRTATGGVVEYRVKAGSDADRMQQLAGRLAAGIAINTTYLAIASPSVAQNTAQLKALTRQVQALLRLQQGNLAALD